jgi:hypothetical protein
MAESKRRTEIRFHPSVVIETSMRETSRHFISPFGREGPDCANRKRANNAAGEAARIILSGAGVVKNSSAPSDEIGYCAQNPAQCRKEATLCLFVLPFFFCSLMGPSTAASRAETLTNLLLTKSIMVFVRPTSFLAN